MRYLLPAIFLLSAPSAFSQAIHNVPKPAAMYLSSDGTGNAGTWVPEAGSGSTGAIPNVPQLLVGAYCSNDGTGNAGTWVPCPVSGGSGATSVSNSDGTLTISPTTGAVVASLNLAHSNIWTANGALSAPAVTWSGTPIATGGTGTTTVPLVLLQPTGTTSTIWNTAGTMFGINAPSGFTGNLFDFQANGGSSLLKLSGGGTLVGSVSQFSVFQTVANCSSSASPAVCAAAAAGSVAVPASGTTLTVNTTRVTANSQIQLTFDSSLGARLGVTCNTAVLQPTVSARTAGTSFTITMSGTVSTNPACISYSILN